MEQEINQLIFNMGSLGTSAPQRRGLSRYYSGKARSFTCIADVRCLEDLKKPKHPDNKKRKKHSEAKNDGGGGGGGNDNIHILPPYACRRVPSCAQFATPYVNV
ncbi:protein OXIDATIVE STRESS 3 LIKE 3-like [Prosopis cineraria]|uniref:protein OXIDATIVE STRESS 3 LIKE 3-like n=1 Tax=Prosopis cineraria TaxID=364024 RepID=UPI00240EB67C|nr:protein OXIDATIVE STRESS 3 LIKE 3-like [Prosopis cineraria]